MELLWEKKIYVENIKVSPRPVWKCRTCEFYGKRLSCPPNTPSWKDAKEWLSFYKYALLLKFKVDMDNFETEKREILNYLLRREKMLFKEYPYVHSLFPGACNLCESCEFEKNGVCKFPTKVRPSIDALGIEVTSITSLRFDEDALYAMILLE